MSQYFSHGFFSGNDMDTGCRAAVKGIAVIHDIIVSFALTSAADRPLSGRIAFSAHRTDCNGTGMPAFQKFRLHMYGNDTADAVSIQSTTRTVIRLGLEVGMEVTVSVRTLQVEVLPRAVRETNCFCARVTDILRRYGRMQNTAASSRKWSGILQRSSPYLAGKALVGAGKPDLGILSDLPTLR